MWDKRVAADTSLYSSAGYDTRWATIAPNLVGHCFRGVPMASGTNKHPVVIYSHGRPAFRKLGSQTAVELASHGYVAVAIDHADCWATEFPDGRYLAGNHSGDLAGRLKDMAFLVDELEVINAGDPLFAGRLDLDRIGVAGGSMGGMVVETCRTNSRVKCAVLYDPNNVQLNPAGLQKPFLVALGETNAYLLQAQWLFSKAETNAVFLQLRGADHYTPCDIGWTAQVPWGRGPTLAMDACRLWFLDTYLKGASPPFPTNPEIYNVQRK
jgi:dienelactone hydrolase